MEEESPHQMTKAFDGTKVSSSVLKEKQVRKWVGILVCGLTWS